MCSMKAPVLVVDDDIDIREALRDTLEQEGYLVVEARDGAEALVYLTKYPPPALILLDWNMSPMNAPQFMEEFMKHPFSTIPVVLLTADTKVDDKAKQHRYVEYLKKPVQLDDLFAVIGRYCQAS
jgi:CheY-like chemotaxis protein